MGSPCWLLVAFTEFAVWAVVEFPVPDLLADPFINWLADLLADHGDCLD